MERGEPRTPRAPGLPIVAARVIADDGDGGSIIIHREINDIDDLAELEAAWKGRGPLCSVVSASCLIDRVWQADWAPALRSAGPSMVLVDIELDRFAPSWRDAETVKAALVRVDDPSGNRWALAVEASNQPILWLALADEVTTALLLEQLRRTPDIHPAVTTEHLAAWHETLPIALTHILATESFLDFDGLTGVL